MNNFGERLKYLREKNKMYQSELAEKLNLAPSTISMYERGDRDPDTSTLSKIAEIFNVTTDYLLGRTDKLKDKTKEDEKLIIAARSDVDLSELTEEEQKYILDFIKMIKNNKKK